MSIWDFVSSVLNILAIAATLLIAVALAMLLFFPDLLTVLFLLVLEAVA